MTNEPHIRWMIRRDMAEVLAIESACFGNPWDESEFIKVLRERNCIGKVVEFDDRIIGFYIYELHHTRIRFVNIAVDPAFHRKGIGSLMVRDQIRKLSYERRKQITLEIRDSNLAGQLFFRACGFRAISVVRDYFDDSNDDAYVMQYRLPIRAEANA